MKKETRKKSSTLVKSGGEAGLVSNLLTSNRGCFNSLHTNPSNSDTGG